MIGKFCAFLIVANISSKAYSRCKLTNNTVIKADTIEACDKKTEDMGADCHELNNDMTILENVKSSCFKKVMNKEIDIMLKKLNKSDFHNQMQVQKLFNSGVKKYCEQFDQCQGTIYYPMHAACFGELYTYRYYQVKKINMKKFDGKVTTPATKIDNGLFPTEFQGYIDGVCIGIEKEISPGFSHDVCKNLIKNELISEGVGSSVCDLGEGG